MLLPIGHDQTTVRRMPWVTFGIMGLCLAIFVLTLLFPGDEQLVGELERLVVEYALDHPYLELDPQLKGFVYYSMRQVRDGAPEPDDSRLVRDEQAELDRLVATYLAARDRLPYWRWGVVPADVHLSALVTYTFLHAGWLHLIGNLFILYLVGPALEDAWGRPLFAVFYVVSGAVAALVFVAAYPNLVEPLIGASGAIAGIMGAFAVRFWNTRITFFYFVWMIRIYQGTFAAPAWLMLGLWALSELAFATGLWAVFSIADVGDVGFLAHVGGFAFGVAAAFAVRALEVEERMVAPVHDRHETVFDAASVDRWLELARVGRTEEAMRGLLDLLARDPADPEAAAALWNTAATGGRDPARVVARVLPAVEAAARAGDAGLLAQLWADVVRRVPEIEIDLRTATRIAEVLMREGLEGDVETTLGWLTHRIDRSTPVGPLVRLARLADRLSVAGPFAALALSHPDLALDLRVELEAFDQRSSGFSA